MSELTKWQYYQDGGGFSQIVYPLKHESTVQQKEKRRTNLHKFMLTYELKLAPQLTQSESRLISKSVTIKEKFNTIS